MRRESVSHGAGATNLTFNAWARNSKDGVQMTVYTDANHSNGLAVYFNADGIFLYQYTNGQSSQLWQK